MQYSSMQSLFDSLCQCLGSSPTLPVDETNPVSNHETTTPGRTLASTPENAHGSDTRSPASRRTNRLELKDKQWDALFDVVKPQHVHKHAGDSPSNSPNSSPSSASRGRASAAAEKGTTSDDIHVSKHEIETAHVLAKAKQAANPSRYHMNSSANTTRDAPPTSNNTSTTTRPNRSKSHKRKRPSTRRDDIFRSRKLGPSVRRSGCDGADGNCMNPISKFLSNHQGFANALCFATPIRDEDEEEEDLREDDRHENNSLASEANTLNTCEDSMLLLDYKLAQMSQNQPPMPLFHDFKVNQNEPEGLRRIVDAETHSSTRMMNVWRQRQDQGFLTEPGQDSAVVHPSSSSSSSSGAQRGRARVRYPPPEPAIPEDEGPPPAMKASTSSSSSDSRHHQHHSSPRQRHHRSIGEI